MQGTQVIRAQIARKQVAQLQVFTQAPHTNTVPPSCFLCEAVANITVSMPQPDLLPNPNDLSTAHPHTYSHVRHFQAMHSALCHCVKCFRHGRMLTNLQGGLDEAAAAVVAVRDASMGLSVDALRLPCVAWAAWAAWAAWVVLPALCWRMEAPGCTSRPCKRCVLLLAGPPPAPAPGLGVLPWAYAVELGRVRPVLEGREGPELWMGVDKVELVVGTGEGREDDRGRAEASPGVSMRPVC